MPANPLGIFGVETDVEKAKLVLLPVPWEVTTSYHAGASFGPELINTASVQVDLYDLETGKPFEQGIHCLEISEDLKNKNNLHKKTAQQIVHEPSPEDAHKLLSVNKACAEMCEHVYQESKNYLAKDQFVAVLGGDHSTPQGLIRALSEKYEGQFGILHIDAHADLRDAYQGFQYSHASIFHNVMSATWKPQKLVQIGIRDFCEEEYEFIRSHRDIQTFFDLDLKRKLFSGSPWVSLCEEIADSLPEKIYVSFDIDGLDPSFCPHTGTPVPGGLSLDQIFCLFSVLAQKGKKWIGFDLNEVSTAGGSLADAEWDGNVGARALYKMSGWLFKTNEISKGV